MFPVWHGCVVWSKGEWSKKSAARRGTLGEFQDMTQDGYKKLCQCLRDESVDKLKLDQISKIIVHLNYCKCFDVMQKIMTFSKFVLGSEF